MALTSRSTFLLLAVLTVFHPLTTGTLVNKKVDRTIDLSTQLVVESVRLLVENTGTNVADQFILQVLPEHAKRVAHISASVAGQQVWLEVEPIADDQYRVKLGNDEHAIKANSQSDLITVQIVYTKLQKPYPEEILQSERQLVNYTGNHYFYSPYLTKSQQTKVKLPASGSIESFSKLKASVQQDRAIAYGPYEQVAALTRSELVVHFENNANFLVVSNLDRKIEVSPWSGVVRIEDTVELYHSGARLKGAFSRYEYQKDNLNGISSVKSLRARLPRSAHNIFYRDEIGNISTSTVRARENMLLVELKPRFPLFGGWKTYFKLGHSLPLSEVVHASGKPNTNRVLSIPFIDHLYDDIVIEQATVRIYLPEGSTNVQVNLPFEAIQEDFYREFTYLDLVGRTVITLHKENLVAEHIQPIEVHYSYSDVWMLQEPLLISAAIVTLCLILYLYVRLDFSIVRRQPLKQKSS